ncbi:hypothetical protein ACFX2A_025475 [Malus domestica]
MTNETFYVQGSRSNDGDCNLALPRRSIKLNVTTKGVTLPPRSTTTPEATTTTVAVISGTLPWQQGHEATVTATLH